MNRCESYEGETSMGTSYVDKYASSTDDDTPASRHYVGSSKDTVDRPMDSQSRREGSCDASGDILNGSTANTVDKSNNLSKIPPKGMPRFGPHPVKKVYKRNQVVERKAQKGMQIMTQELKSKTLVLDKRIRHMEDQLKDLSLEQNYHCETEHQHEHDASQLSFPAIPSSRRQGSSSSSRRHSSTGSHRCSYNHARTKQNCHHFPCVVPTTYHTIGYRGNPACTSWMSWESIKKSWDSRHLNDGVSPSVHDVRASASVLTQRRENKLRRVIEHRRSMNHMKRPRDWVTNYGQPTPYKILKFPVRRNSMTGI